MEPVEFKLVVLGDKDVGKTSLVIRYTQGFFENKTTSTVGAFYLTKKYTSKEGIPCKMNIWDTAGQERFRAMAPMYYRGANAAVVCFDITQEESFEKMKDWVEELRKNGKRKILPSRVDSGNNSNNTTLELSSESESQTNDSIDEGEGIILVIAATKSDLSEQRKVSKNRAEDYAVSIGAILFETSSKENRGVDQLFERISEEVLIVKRREIDTKNMDFGRPSVMLGGPEKHKRDGGCCLFSK